MCYCVFTLARSTNVNIHTHTYVMIVSSCLHQHTGLDYNILQHLEAQARCLCQSHSEEIKIVWSTESQANLAGVKFLTANWC